MITFTHTTTLAPAQLALLEPVAARYGAALTEVSSLSGAAINPASRVQVAISLKGDAPGPLPASNHPDYLRTAARVSVALQEALRAWLPCLWFADVARFSDFDLAATVVNYAALRPFTPKTKASYVFDVLDSDTPRAVTFSLQRNLPAKLSGIEPMLRALGFEPAVQFAPRRAERLIATFKRKPQLLYSLFVAERELVEQYLGRRDAKLIGRRLKRLFAAKDFSMLEPLLALEVARALGGTISAEITISPEIFVTPAALAPHDNPSVSPADAAGVPAALAYLNLESRGGREDRA
ncbi:MAG: hypothetical protein NTV70_22115 [Acidobacteria bacterium]|nr:hypothetical protein [Acidobacteriota bacterium]